MKALKAKLRPADRVHQYLLQEFGSTSDTSIKRLPTMRQVSEHLKVSLPTVQTVYQRLSREGYVTTHTGVGSFFNPKPTAISNRTYRIAMDISPTSAALDHSHYWIDNMYGAVFRAVLRESKRVQFLSLPGNDDEMAREFERNAKKGDYDGLLIHGFEERLESIAEKYNIPIVYLHDPRPDVTTNFVSPNVFRYAFAAGRAFAAEGRKKVLYLENIDMLRAREALLYAGLAAGIGKPLDREVDFRYLNVGAKSDWDVGDLESYMEKHSFVPDAIFSSGDYLAIAAMRMMAQRGHKVRRDYSIIGGTGVDVGASEWATLTRVVHPFNKIGSELLRFICQRIEGKGIDIPGVYFDCQFAGGGTTTAKANEILGLH